MLLNEGTRNESLPSDLHSELISISITDSPSPKPINDLDESRENGLHTVSLPHWTAYEPPDRHFWNNTGASGVNCCLSESECLKTGQRKKCTVCKMVCHKICIPKLKISCRITFREAHPQNYRDPNSDQLSIKHHWILRRYHEMKCQACGKRIQAKFKIKDAIYRQCTWCKLCYHDRPECFTKLRLNGTCSLGKFANLIIPPTWIVKIFDNDLLKESFHRSPSNPAFSICLRTDVEYVSGARLSSGDLNSMKGVSQSSCALSLPKSPVDARPSSVATDRFPFVLKANPTFNSNSGPLIVFINPRSGGNQGLKLIQKFQWHLNPRQVFSLDNAGPKLGLKLYGNIPNIRILVCGGDGTVGWLLSEIDALGIYPQPPIAILPLGTGNDLARTLHWGPGYADESIKKILKQIVEGRIVSLDRWNISSKPQPHDSGRESGIQEHEKDITTQMPLKVINNYFSLGSDAATALEFHESREANPDKFQSRIRNKIFYAGVGGLDLIRRTWRGLVDDLELICDGVNMRKKLQEIKPHVILFLNIPKYSAGTVPWGQPSDSESVQRIDDKRIEVIGLTTASLAALQVGRHGDRICQCSSVKLTTMKAIPMQIDGEPFRLCPSEIEISWKNHASMIQKESLSATNSPARWIDSDQVRSVNAFIIVSKQNGISVDLDALCRTARLYATVVIGTNVDLRTARRILTDDEGLRLVQKCQNLPRDWVFLDMTAINGKVFSIAPSFESSYYVGDILSNHDELFLIDVTTNNEYLNKPLVDNLSENSAYNFQRTENAKRGWLILQKAVIHRRSRSEVQMRNEQTESTMSTLPAAVSKRIVHSMTDIAIPTININSKKIANIPEVSKLLACHEKALNTLETSRFSKVQKKNDHIEANTYNLPTRFDVALVSQIPACVSPLNYFDNLMQKNCGSLAVKGVVSGHDNAEHFFPKESSGLSETDKFKRFLLGNPLLCDMQFDQDKKLKTKFLLACLDGNLDLIEEAVSAGASTLSCDATGRSGLHLASKAGRLEVVNFLLTTSPKFLLDMQDFKKKQTALHIAAHYRRRHICEALVCAGASVSCKDANGQRPRHVAIQSRDKDLALFLQRHEILQTILKERKSAEI